MTKGAAKKTDQSFTPMKVFSVAGYFLLPADFKGTYSDALRAMADYHDYVAKNKLPRKVGKRPKGCECSTQLWEDFTAALVKRQRLCANMIVTTFIEDKWVEQKTE